MTLSFIFEKQMHRKDTEGKTRQRHEYSAENENTTCVTHERQIASEDENWDEMYDATYWYETWREWGSLGYVTTNGVQGEKNVWWSWNVCKLGSAKTAEAYSLGLCAMWWKRFCIQSILKLLSQWEDRRIWSEL